MAQARQLAAIMFTDIEGYTAMMQYDEDSAIKIRDHHRKVFNASTEKFGGTILQYFGDGTLSTFNSAIEAVQCAAEMQIEFQKEPLVPVRIGIHIGDIVIRDDEIIGDGVNVASRIESLAIPGSVLISDKVNDEIKNHPSIETRSLNTFDLKNVDKPVEVFAISNRGLIIPDKEQIKGKTKDKTTRSEKEADEEELRLSKKKLKWALMFIIGIVVIAAVVFIYQQYFQFNINTTDQKKSIAVLPFTNMSNDSSQEYFSDGITEDILTHLSKIADLKVVSRTSTIQYKNTTKTIPQIGKELGVTTILEGSVRKSGTHVRITAQLIDAKTDMHLWAETYDREIDKIFDIQTEVATEIATVLKATLSRKEKENLAKPVTSEITAYDYYLRGMEALNRGESQDDLHLANNYFQEAIKIDTAFASAYVGLAWSLVYSGIYGAGEEIWQDSVFALTEKALSLDNELDEAYFLKAEIYNLKRETKKAIWAYERTLKLNPNHDRAMMELGAILLEQNEMERGIQLIMDGLMLQLNRKEPNFYSFLGEAYFQIGETDNAKYYFKQALKLDPGYQEAYYWLAEIGLQEKNYNDVLTYILDLVSINKNVNSLDRLAWAYMLVEDYQAAADVWIEIGNMQADFEDQYFAVAYKHRLAYVMWQMGQKKEAQKMFDEFIIHNLAIIETGTESHIQGHAYDLAGVYAFLGKNKEAIKWARIADKMGFFPAGIVDRDPLFNNIRSDKEFKEIMLKKKKEEKTIEPRLQIIKVKIREMEESGVLTME